MLAGIAEKVLKSIRRDVEEKGSQLSSSGGGKAGKSEVIASCSFLEGDFQECSKRESWQRASKRQ